MIIPLVLLLLSFGLFGWLLPHEGILAALLSLGVTWGYLFWRFPKEWNPDDVLVSSEPYAYKRDRKTMIGYTAFYSAVLLIIAIFKTG